MLENIWPDLSQNSSNSLLRLNFKVIKVSSLGFAKMPCWNLAALKSQNFLLQQNGRRQRAFPRKRASVCVYEKNIFVRFQKVKLSFHCQLKIIKIKVKLAILCPKDILNSFYNFSHRQWLFSRARKWQLDNKMRKFPCNNERYDLIFYHVKKRSFTIKIGVPGECLSSRLLGYHFDGSYKIKQSSSVKFSENLTQSKEEKFNDALESKFFKPELTQSTQKNETFWQALYKYTYRPRKKLYRNLQRLLFSYFLLFRYHSPSLLWWPLSWLMKDLRRI